LTKSAAASTSSIRTIDEVNPRAAASDDSSGHAGTVSVQW
jgi:hypothetical protein